jgi:uncharacterized protein YndB with AHSA1/START domain
MAPIVMQTEVEGMPTEVFQYVTDPSHFHEWQENVVTGCMDSADPVAVGSTCLTTRRIGGAERIVTSRVTKLDPPRNWAIRGVDGPIRAIVDVTVEPAVDGARSRVTIELEFTGHGIGKLLVPLLVRPQSRKEMQRNMQRLRTRIENTATP